MAKQQVDALLILRAALGAWLILAPWVLPLCDSMHRLSGALSGGLMLLVAFYAERRPSLRWLQAAIGLWVACSAALLEPGPIMINSMVMGHVLLVSAIVTRALFTDEPEETEE